MFKKITLYSATMLAVGSIVAVAIPQDVTLANTNISTKNSLVNAREIHGAFSGELHEGMGIQPVTLGAIEYVLPPFITLDVLNGGPENLSWSASIENLTTGQQVSNWTEFQHGYNSLSLNLDKTKIHIGDTLQLQLHANSGEGNISIIAGL